MKNQSNLELVTELMNHSRQGAMMQMFLMTALEKYAVSVASNPEKPDGWPDMLNWDAWLACAEETVQALDKRA